MFFRNKEKQPFEKSEKDTDGKTYAMSNTSFMKQHWVLPVGVLISLILWLQFSGP